MHLLDEFLRLSYHGLRAKVSSFNATMQTTFDKDIGKINIIPQDIGRVFLNLFTNAFYSVNEKKKQLAFPASCGKRRHASVQGQYEPTVIVTTRKLNPAGNGSHGEIEIRIRDNGMGVPQKVSIKSFNHFFTTKPTGEGTGLGLSISYDIIKVHGGVLKMETKEGEFAEFIILLPCA